MNTFYQGFLTALIPSLIVAVVTAVVTARLTVNQYCSKKWWDKKFDAYSRIMEQLSIVRLFLNRNFDHLTGVDVSKEFWIKIRPEYLEAKIELEKASMAGAYIIDDRATTLLVEFIKVLDWRDPEGDWTEEFDRQFGKVSACIDDIERIAKEDLRKEQRIFLFK